MTVRFAYGYTPDARGVQGLGQMLTEAELNTKATWFLLDPEFKRRVVAMMKEAARQGIPLGPGTGWRPENPNKPGFASNGNSNHQSFPYTSRTPTAVAADMVPNTSWNWMEQNAGRFGLRTFRNVNGEPWHIQPIDIPASRGWRSVPWKLAKWNLPGDTPPPPKPVPAMPPFDPANRKYSLWPIAKKRAIGAFYSGDEVRYLKGVMKFEASRFLAWFAAHPDYDKIMRVSVTFKNRDEWQTNTRRNLANWAATLCKGLDPNNPVFDGTLYDAVLCMQAALNDTYMDGRKTVLYPDGGVGIQTWAFIDRIADGNWK